MAIKNINVNGQDYPIGGGGSFISATLYHSSRYYEKDSVFVVCQEGQIKETDTLAFARYIGGHSGKSYNRPGREGELSRYKYRGWIVPHNKQGKEYISYHLRYDKTIDGMDYWEIVSKDDDGFFASLRFMHDKESGEVINAVCINEGFGEVAVSRKCGFAVVRDGVRISEYMHFRVLVSKDETGWPFCSIGLW